MFENNSPWIKQLNRVRPIEIIDKNLETDIVVVGGGIAGITTAYFLLSNTNKNVCLIEAGKIAHGATGHNAGQITGYFEIPFKEMVKRFGLNKSVKAEKLINDDARILLEKIVVDAKIQTPFSQFVGYDGWISREQVLFDLENLYLKAEGGLRIRQMLIAKEWLDKEKIDKKYSGLYIVVPQKSILSALETVDKRYIAATPFLSGCMNSALFSEEVASYLVSSFKERFKLFESSPVEIINLNKAESTVFVGQYQVKTKKIILCTNGFEDISIYEEDKNSLINTRYHKNIEGVIGFMVAYLENLDRSPFASSYNSVTKEEIKKVTDSPDLSDPYFYVTRRPYEFDKNLKHNLISVGGPDRRLKEGEKYNPKMHSPKEITNLIEEFVGKTFNRKNNNFDFHWHGLMGYTSTGFRIIGEDPYNKSLIYNLGCNGVGILPSIYGAFRVSKVINKEVIEPTIFDPI